MNKKEQKEKREHEWPPIEDWEYTKLAEEERYCENEQCEELLKNRYEESKHVPLRSHTYSIFLVKQIAKHTPHHTFLLHAIYEEILKYTHKVNTDETSRHELLNPDIIFTNEKGNEVALEIETGVNLKKNTTYMKEKVAKLNEQYSTWYFILTNKDWKTRYQNAFKKEILLRGDIQAFLRKHFPNTEP